MRLISMNQTTPDVSICIVNWNTGDLLGKCIQSILEHTHRISYEVIVVDNQSTDHSMLLPRELAAQDERVIIVDAQANLGFAAGNNVAIRMARGRIVVLLNPDTEVTPSAIDKGVTLLEINPTCGVLGPKLLNPDGTLQPSIGNFPTVNGMFWELTRLRKIFPSVRLFSSFKRFDLDYSRMQAVEQPSGACLFIRREALDQAGIFDERYFMYYEEVDLCYRIHRAGWTILYTPEIEVIHYGGQSSGKNVDVRIVENSRSKLLYFAKNYSGQLGANLLVRLLVLLEVALKSSRLLLLSVMHKATPEQVNTLLPRYCKVAALVITTPF